jgi:hypothetical protein
MCILFWEGRLDINGSVIVIGFDDVSTWYISYSGISEYKTYVGFVRTGEIVYAVYVLGPVGPVAPVFTAVPATPVGPVGPVGPVLPVGPVRPGPRFHVFIRISNEPWLCLNIYYGRNKFYEFHTRNVFIYVDTVQSTTRIYNINMRANLVKNVGLSVFNRVLYEYVKITTLQIDVTKERMEFRIFVVEIKEYSNVVCVVGRSME